MMRRLGLRDDQCERIKDLLPGREDSVGVIGELKAAHVALRQPFDNGPYIDGRIVDITPKVAEQLGMQKAGVIPVIIAPIVVPQPDGGAKLGAGAMEATPDEVAEAP
jgi:hypothetical protein